MEQVDGSTQGERSTIAKYWIGTDTVIQVLCSESISLVDLIMPSSQKWSEVR